jgi:hypothetical protein
VVVGSALVGRIPGLLEQPDAIPASLAEILSGMRAAIDRQAG